MINGDGVDDPGEDPNRLLNSYCVPCSIGQFCPSKDGEPGAQAAQRGRRAGLAAGRWQFELRAAGSGAAQVAAHPR